MASKFRLITELYEYTTKKVCESPTAWTAFLRSACGRILRSSFALYAGRKNIRSGYGRKLNTEKHHLKNQSTFPVFFYQPHRDLVTYL